MTNRWTVYVNVYNENFGWDWEVSYAGNDENKAMDAFIQATYSDGARLEFSTTGIGG